MAISGGRTLMVYLAADTANFKRNMNQAETTASGFGSKISSLGTSLTNMLGPALLGAGIAAGAMAVKFGVDGVQAFMDDEAAAAKLATTLGNLGFEGATTQVEGMIDAQQRLTGIADDQLRPAFDRLIRSTNDVGTATNALKLAQDISKGASIELSSVANALGKAYDGNFIALNKLGTGIDKAVLATGDMEVISKALADTFGGQAATAAATYQGQVQRLGVAFGELQESFGRGFLSALGDTTGQTNDLMIAMQRAEPAMETIGGLVADIGITLANSTARLSDFQQGWADLAAQDTIAGRWAKGWADAIYGILAGPVQQFDDFQRQKLKPADARTGGGYVPMSQPSTAGAGPSMGGGNSGQWANFYAVNASGSQKWADATAKLNQGLLDLNPNVTKLSGGGAETAKDFTSVKEAMATASEQINTQFAPALDMAQTALDAVRQKAVEYADSIKNAITGTISLSKAWSDAVAAGSSNKGMDAISGLQKQLVDATAFTTAFKGLKDDPNVSQALQDQIVGLMQAQGPVAGTEFIKAMTPAIALQLSTDMQALDVFAGEAGVAMSKKFYDQGTQDAVDMLNGISEEIQKQQKSLKQLGENIGGPIADEVTKQIQRAIRNGLAAGQAEADRQEAAAFALSSASRVTKIAVGQGITAVVTQTNQTTGSAPARPLR
jgi:hypothetical protein